MNIEIQCDIFINELTLYESNLSLYILNYYQFSKRNMLIFSLINKWNEIYRIISIESFLTFFSSIMDQQSIMLDSSNLKSVRTKNF